MSRLRPSRRLRLLEALLAEAGIDAAPVDANPLPIGSAGLNIRGDRDEDGVHVRAVLDDGRRVILREYATTSQSRELYRLKELAVYGLLRDHGLHGPEVLATIDGGSLLLDPGGEPLEVVFRDVPALERAAVWTVVGEAFRRLHTIPLDAAAFLQAPQYQRPWTRLVPYFLKSLKAVTQVRPDLAAYVDALVGMRAPLTAYVEARPAAVTVANVGGYLPGLMLERADAPEAWRCTGWLNVGYYSAIADPARDLAVAALAHREWTGADVPIEFYDAYGARPDPVATALYTAAMTLSRGAAYLRGPRRSCSVPPPHSQAVAALDGLPALVDLLASEIGARTSA